MTPQYQSIPKHGGYIVGDRVFEYKVPALIYGTETNQHPIWYFHTNEFNAYDWSVEPKESLRELYKQRAQQIRDKYNHVSLMYSGGADSHNILTAFLANGIKIDEVYVSWHVDLCEKYETDPLEKYWTNINSEWELTIKPRLKWLATYHPDVKITINDWTKNIHNVGLSDEFLLDRNHSFSPYSNRRWDKQVLLDQADKKNGVLLIGIDKPNICYHEGQYKLYFLDVLAQMILPQEGPEAENVEFFYWSKDACKVIAKQAHTIANFFDTNKQHNSLIQWGAPNYMNRQMSNIIVRTLIYPDVDTQVFQAYKPMTLNLGMDFLFSDTELSDYLKKKLAVNWNNARHLIDPKYFQNQDGEDTLIGFFNGMWTIKNETPINHD